MNNNDKNESCSIFTDQTISFAMAYVPWQTWKETYDPSVGFQRGTIFPCLDKPFIGEGAIPNER